MEKEKQKQHLIDIMRGDEELGLYYEPMSNKKISSIDWLVEQLTPSISLQQKHIDDLKEKAKEMHKEEIVEAFNEGALDTLPFGEQYYQQTFDVT